MPIVRFIRHGESTGNIGEMTTEPHAIPLTPRGHDQALAIGRNFAAAPDLIISSPYLRARQTAAPTSERFPAVPVEIWPVHEFTYLSPAAYNNSTPAQRRPSVEAYWQRADPFGIDGPGAESFAGLMDRVRSALSRLAALSEAMVVAFSHGQFMRAAWLHIAGDLQEMNADAMRAFRAFDNTHPIANGAGFRIIWNGRTWRPEPPSA